MTALLYPGQTAPDALPPGAPAGTRSTRGLRRFGLESAIVFAISAAVLIAIGIYTVVDLHVVYSDGQSRLAHAYFVWWNKPAKLAAIGFVWPPMQTLALLPFAIIKPLATSLAALPVFAGLCGAGVITTLNRTLRSVRVERKWRYPLLLAFAANPVFLDYASNGMAEILFLLLLSLGVHHFVQWYLGEGYHVRPLLMSGVYMALGFLARYELGLWILLMAACVAWLKRRRDSSYQEVEANVLLFLAPFLYVTACWSIISMMVIGGGPLSWFSAASNQGQGAVLHASTAKIAADTFIITGRISPALWVVPVALLGLGIAKRQQFALMLAAMTLVGALTTFVLTAHSPHIGLLQIRYNIRALPVMLVAGGWLLREITGRALRTAAGLALLGSLVAAIPLAYDAMKHYPYQYEEQAFIRALTTGKDQDGTSSIGDYAIGDSVEKAMARYIDDHVHREKSILVDDGALPGVILVSGRPQLFVTRIDHGDGRWLRILARPWGKVQYLLVSTNSATGSQGDLIEAHHPGAATGDFPGATVVYRTSQSVLMRLSAQPPPGVTRATPPVR